MGDLFDESAETYKALSDEQQHLSIQVWDTGPQLIRGVAGSGKTIVLANNLARRIQRSMASQANLFEFETPTIRPQFAVVCFNRTLAPYIAKKIDLAYRQRTGGRLPDDVVEVWSYNRMMWHLSGKGAWRYQKFGASSDTERAAQYLRELTDLKQHDPSCLDRFGYDAIYVDEGQDFGEHDFRLLKELCRSGGEPSLFVFYDDAQNLYGHPRPNWRSLGINVVGRSSVMSECFRNTLEVVESTFNVLYGTFATEAAAVPTKAFGDIATLEEKNLLRRVDGVYRVNFARRRGMKPRISVRSNRMKQWADLVERLRWLTERQQVRPEDIHVLVYYKNQIDDLAQFIQAARIPAIEGIHVSVANKDELLQRKGQLCISTVASAKGYDAYCVLIANGHDFPTDVHGRASFYVACTRAIEYLEIFASSNSGLVGEMEHAVAALP